MAANPDLDILLGIMRGEVAEALRGEGLLVGGPPSLFLAGLSLRGLLPASHARVRLNVQVRVGLALFCRVHWVIMSDVVRGWHRHGYNILV